MSKFNEISEPQWPNWLEVLPPDVKIRIVTIACAGQYDLTALELAEISPFMRKAVAAAFGYKLNILAISAHTPDRWLDVFKDLVREITCDSFWVAHLRFRVLNLLNSAYASSALKIAEILDDVAYWRAINGMKTIRKLKVYVLYDSRFVSEEDKGIRVEVLKTLDLEKIDLKCHASTDVDCPFGRTGEWAEALCALPEICPTLQAFSTFCSEKHPEYVIMYDGDETPQVAPLWATLPKFQSLRYVTFDTEPPTSVIPALRRIENVGLSAPCDISVATQIGPVITALHPKEVLGESGLSALSIFTRMEWLSVVIERGAEHALPDNLHNMISLQSFKLQVAKEENNNSNNQPGGQNANEENGLNAEPNAPVNVNNVAEQDANVNELPLSAPVPGAENWDVAMLYEISPGTLLRLVHACPRLSSLELLGMRLSMTELEDILKCCGRQLEHLSVPIMDQVDLPMYRLESILLALMAYNPSIRSFRTERRKLFYSALTDFQTWPTQRARLFSLMDRLELRNPHVDLNELRDSIKRIPAKPS